MKKLYPQATESATEKFDDCAHLVRSWDYLDHRAALEGLALLRAFRVGRRSHQFPNPIELNFRPAVRIGGPR